MADTYNILKPKNIINDQSFIDVLLDRMVIEGARLQVAENDNNDIERFFAHMNAGKYIR